MPIGKDSITKRVAKPATKEAQNTPTKKTSPTSKAPDEERNIAPELVATTAAAPIPKKAPVKKAASEKTATDKPSSAKKTASPVKKAVPSTTKSDAAAKPKTTKADTKPEKTVETTVLANVSPETVKAVIGHGENEKYEKVQLGQKMPDFLL